MVNEYWGTFSIYDHRNPIFRTSLILFDRIVIPIPENPIGTLTQKEIDQLYTDASFLEKNGAAVIYKWKQKEFSDWQTDIIKEALTVKQRDGLFDTRLMLQTRIDTLKPDDVYDITAVPVYGARQEFSDAYTQKIPTKNNLLLELSQFISVPDDTTSLESIVELRHTEQFQSARRALRDWQIKKMPDALKGDSRKDILLAKEEFEQMLKRYEEEIKKGKFGKKKVVVTSLLALGALFAAAAGQIPAAIGLISGAAPHLFSLKESFSPTWKDLRDKEFEAAGVIYEANRIFK